MLAEIGLASFEVIARRTAMMIGGTCSPAEYRRMVREKMAAATTTARHIAGGRTSAKLLLSPWHTKTRANVKRLRRL